MNTSDADILEGTGEELRRVLEQFPKDRFRLIPLTPKDVLPQPNGIDADSGSLYDLLGDYVGCVEGDGQSNAARASELFSEQVAAKRRESNL